MAKEAFLANPPRKISKKLKKKHRKIHRILALESKGGMFTSKEAKIVRKGIKLNPFRRNPFGEELMFVGLNPFPKKGGKTMAKKRRHKRNPAKKHRRYRRNPMSSTKSLVPMVISGGLGNMAGRVVPQFIPILNKMGILGNVITKAGIAIGGAKIIDMLGLDKMQGIKYLLNADGWLIGSFSAAFSDLAGISIVNGLAGLGMIEDDTLAPYSMGELVQAGGSVDPYAGENGNGMGEFVEPY
jgi:hypothetical protein